MKKKTFVAEVHAPKIRSTGIVNGGAGPSTACVLLLRVFILRYFKLLTVPSRAPKFSASQSVTQHRFRLGHVPLDLFDRFLESGVWEACVAFWFILLSLQVL